MPASAPWKRGADTGTNSKNKEIEMSVRLKKYIILYSDVDDNFDLLICAESRKAALEMWQDYYDLTPGEYHPGVILIPDDFGAVAGAIPWDELVEATE